MLKGLKDIACVNIYPLKDESDEMHRRGHKHTFMIILLFL